MAYLFYEKDEFNDDISAWDAHGQCRNQRFETPRLFGEVSRARRTSPDAAVSSRRRRGGVALTPRVRCINPERAL